MDNEASLNQYYADDFIYQTLLNPLSMWYEQDNNNCCFQPMNVEFIIVHYPSLIHLERKANHSILVQFSISFIDLVIPFM